MKKTKKPTTPSKDNLPKPSGYRRFLPTNWPKKLKIGALAVLLLSVIGLVVAKTYLPVDLDAPRDSISTQGAITIKLSQLLSSVDTSKVKLTPAVEGKWEYQRGNILNGDRLIFTPKKYFKENTRKFSLLYR